MHFPEKNCIHFYEISLNIDPDGAINNHDSMIPFNCWFVVQWTTVNTKTVSSYQVFRYFQIRWHVMNMHLSCSCFTVDYLTDFLVTVSDAAFPVTYDQLSSPFIWCGQYSRYPPVSLWGRVTCSPVREITKSSSTFFATNISSNIV